MRAWAAAFAFGLAALAATCSCAAPDDACLTASQPALFAPLRARPARSLIVVDRLIPSGWTGATSLSGPIATTAPGAPLDFRIFVADRSLDIFRLGRLDLAERHPIEVSPDTPVKDSVRLRFVAPADDDWNPLHLYSRRTLVVVACDGPRTAAWGAATLNFAAPIPAIAWAIVFALAIYVCTAIVVYGVRRRGRSAMDDPTRLYRIAAVEPWSIGRCLNPVAMTADKFDRGSLSKFQILIFVLLVSYSLADLVLWTGVVSDLSSSIVLLLGIPAVGTLGSQLAATTRDRFSASNWAFLVSRHVLPLNDPGNGRGPRWADLIMSDAELDLYKLQALAFSFIVAIGLLATGVAELAKFEVPATLLQILGLSQAVFVGGRFVKPTTVGDLDARITELRAREAALRRAVTLGVDVAADGKAIADAAPKPPQAPPRTAAAARALAPVAWQRYCETADEVQVLLEALSDRVVDGHRLREPRFA